MVKRKEIHDWIDSKEYLVITISIFSMGVIYGHYVTRTAIGLILGILIFGLFFSILRWGDLNK